MAFEGVKDNIPGLTTVTDLSAKQYYFVKLSADKTVALTAAATDCPVGILDDGAKGTASVPAAASVVFKGVAKITLGGTVAAGDRVATKNDGTAVKVTEGTDITTYIVGQMLEGGAAGDVRSVLLSGTPHRAA